MDNDIKGNKHICNKCDIKYYDLNKSNITCPRCGDEKKERSMPKEIETIKSMEKVDLEVEEILKDDLDILEDDSDDKEDHIINVE